MKKSMLLALLSLSIFFAAAGCQGDPSPASSAADAAVECEFETQYIRTNGWHEDTVYPVITPVSSQKELETYYQSAGLLYDFAHAYSDLSFAEAMKKYDDAFFEDHMLLLVLLEESSGSVKHKVISAVTESEVTALEINRYSTEVQSCDMAEWHIFVELRRGQAGKTFEAKISKTLGTMEEYEASN